MGVFEGLLGGFLDRKYAIEEENRRQGELASERERGIFSTLLNSEDPETQQIALAGLLDSANPRKKAGGLRGWIGETLESPHLARIRALSPTISEQQPVMTLPSRQMSGAQAGPVQPTVLPGANPDYEIGDPAATITQPSPVQPGAPPPVPTTYTQAPPSPSGMMRMVARPRNVFPSPESLDFRRAIAKERAEPAGMKAGLVAAGLSDADATDVVKEHYLRRYGASAGLGQSISGEAPDETGAFKPTFGVFNRLRNTYDYPGTTTAIPGFRPRTTTASTSMGVQIEPLARARFGKRGAELSQTEMAEVLELSKLQKNVLTSKDALTLANQYMPNATNDQRLELANALLSGSQAPVSPVGGPPSPAAASRTAPSTGTPLVAPPAPPAATGAPPQASVGPPRISIPPSLAEGSKETGKPQPPAVAQALARAKASNDLIDQALAALEPYKNDNSTETTLKLAKDYRQGIFDPDAGVAMQLSDLAGLQQSASQQLVAGGSRAIQTYLDRRQHVPRLPSGRQVEFYASGAPATAVGKVSRFLSSEGGWDSPKLMYEKLLGAKMNNQNFIKEIEGEAARVKPLPRHEAGAGPKAYQDANGNWVIRQ